MFRRFMVMMLACVLACSVLGCGKKEEPTLGDRLGDATKEAEKAAADAKKEAEKAAAAAKEEAEKAAEAAKKAADEATD